MYDQWHRTGRGALRALIGATILIATPAAAATRGYTITSFDAIRVDAPVTVIVTTGAGASARAEGDQALLDRLNVAVSGRLLIVGITRARPGEKGGGAATLRVEGADGRGAAEPFRVAAAVLLDCGPVEVDGAALALRAAARPPPVPDVQQQSGSQAPASPPYHRR